mmetsp:Transcript_34638/g.107872  ORF Transcript_34638/g.107872 Transcript_34638/m.107872 type:complete len:395 (-) Transcript_34638:86-1270(-)|eukprot:CAMPEP_0175781394 /NCGR_PEP_ID=MMETSP0097-20121207/77248_1 /TAXON_ID=311494 /ORGANISM="Alexandrium monilatum, Strain CCMP3105" /LENGTH=394 /DNA_ID=CAMNT_0017092189 /DNA_START=10 /DNA_END=1194 /DNA_ORIENTATION=+
MALTPVVSFALAASLLGLVVPCGASEWQATAEDAEASLIAELSGLVRTGQPHRLEAALRPIYEASPKGALGGLEPEAARAALRRFFMQRPGWSLNTGSEAWVPAHLQKLLEERADGRRLGLRELSALAASLEELTRREATAVLEQSYRSAGLPLLGRSERGRVIQALRLYGAAYLGGQASEWLDRLEEEQWKAGESHDGKLSFQEASSAVLAIERQFSRFKGQECSGLQATAADSHCLNVSSLYSLCCRGSGEEPAPPRSPAPSVWAEAWAEFPELWIFSEACLLLSALVAFAGRLSGPARTEGTVAPKEVAVGTVAAEPKTPVEDDDAAKPAQAPARQSSFLVSSLALCFLCPVAVAVDILDVSIIAPALTAGLALLAVARLAPRQPAEAKKV